MIARGYGGPRSRRTTPELRLAGTWLRLGGVEALRRSGQHARRHARVAKSSVRRACGLTLALRSQLFYLGRDVPDRRLRPQIDAVVAGPDRHPRDSFRRGGRRRSRLLALRRRMALVAFFATTWGAAAIRRRAHRVERGRLAEGVSSVALQRVAKAIRLGASFADWASFRVLVS